MINADKNNKFAFLILLSAFTFFICFFLNRSDPYILHRFLFSSISSFIYFSVDDMNFRKFSERSEKQATERT